MSMTVESCGCIEKHFGAPKTEDNQKKQTLTSVLNEEYTEKIKEINIHLRKAHDIYESLPDCIKSSTPSNPDGDMRKYIAESINLSNRFAWGFGIDV